MENLERALFRLKEALDISDSEENTLFVDGTIQRFEFCIELFWKTLRRALFENGIESGTPREALQKAYQAKWLDDEQMWIQMLRDRNQTSHVYQEEIANEIFERIPGYYENMTKALEDIKRRV